MDCTRRLQSVAWMALLALPAHSSPASPASQDPSAPDGFKVQRAVGPARSYLSVCVEPGGDLLLGTEAQGLWRVRDTDGDGFAESEEVLEGDLVGVQGLARSAQAIFAVGRAGEDTGLWRLDLDGAGQPTGRRLLVGFDSDDEHGAHGVEVALDGSLLLTHGDAVQPLDAPSPTATWKPEPGPELLPALPDPGAFGASRRWPYGQVLRVDAETGAYEPYAAGLRNAYDMALRADGEWFTVDSDMEWDIGLPWYRPVRALLLQRRADFGARPGSAPVRAGWPDAPPAIAELERSSPTGMVFVEHPAWPAGWQGRLLVGDWLEGRVLALDLEPDGAGYLALPLDFLGGSAAMPVTDLAIAQDGALVLCSGGRGAAGSVWRVLPPGHAEWSPAGSLLEQSLAQPQPTSAAGRAALRGRIEQTPALWDVLLAAALAPERSAAERARAVLAMAMGDPVAFAQLAAACTPAQAQLMGPTALALLLDVHPTSPAADLAVSADEDPTAQAATRRAFARSDQGRFTPEQVLARSVDPWLLYARRPFVNVALAGGPPRTGKVLHKNDWWFEKHLARPHLGDFEASSDLVSFLWLDMPPATRVRQLRTVARILGSGAKLDSRVVPNLDERLRRLLKESDPGILGLVTQLVAWRAFPGSAAALLDLLESTGSREVAIDAVAALHELRADLAQAERARLFAFHDEAAGWTGGGNFQPVLASLLRMLVESTPDDQLRALGQAGQLGGRALATALAARADLAADLAPSFQAAWTELEASPELEPAELVATQRSLLRSLEGCSLETLTALGDWLRTLNAPGTGLREDAVILLAGLDADEDFATVAAGLLSGRFDVREACTGYLMASPLRPDDPRMTWDALRKARSLGERAGTRPAAVAALWLDVPALRPDAWDDEMLRLERAFAERYPDWQPPQPGPLDGPNWTLEQLAGFLELTSARPASSARGALVYGQLGCDACHVLGGDGGGWGPPLDGVTKRMATGDLLRAIVDPSAEIADRYASTRVTLAGGMRHEGRLAREGADELEIWLPAGTRIVVPRKDVIATEPAELSPMPSGLLDGVSLEQLRDLFAHLAADGAIDPADAAGAAWIDLLGDANRSHWGGQTAGWRLEGRVLEGSAEDLPQSTYLVYDQPFSDFEIEFDVFAPDANSGLQYRSRVDPASPDPIGYQADVGKAWWGSLFATDGRGAIAQPDREELHAVNWKGWNHYYLRIEGDRHVIELNGKPMVDARDDVFSTGIFALQLHQKMKMQVWYANLRVRPL